MFKVKRYLLKENPLSFPMNRFRTRSSLWLQHIQWVCRNVVNLDEQKGKTLRNKDITRLRNLSLSGQSKYVPEMVKWLNILESTEYATPMLTSHYLQHLQTLAKMPDSRVDEVAEHIMLIYHNIVMALKFLDLDLHHSMYYQIMSLLQQYHTLANAEYTTETFDSAYKPYIESVHEKLKLLQSMTQSKILTIPAQALQLWLDDVTFVLGKFVISESD
jgi:hypothetical protein